VIVVDASTVVDFLLERGPLGDWAAERIRTADSLHAPHLLDFEVASGIRRKAAVGEIPHRRGRAALTDLGDMRLTRYPGVALVDRMWALREGLSAYDASYVALAEALEAPLVTTDRRLAATSGHEAVVETAPG
jgi:predicted nucleic acid-binding protein